MRNDEHDELDQVPSLSASRERDEPYPAPDLQPIPAARRPQSPAPRARSRLGSVSLWALVLVLLIALGALGWWSHLQIDLLRQQLVATQDSFAQISEEAAGRLSDIRGQVVAAESSVTTESEALKLRLKQVERQLAELDGRQQVLLGEQKAMADRQSGQAKLLESLKGADQALTSEQSNQKAALDKLVRQGEALAGAHTKLEGRIDSQAEVGKTLSGLQDDVAALKKRPDVSQALKRVEQDLLVLRSELDNRPAGGINVSEFDAYRAQVNRTINAMQNQIANLQAQLGGR